jgi:Zinc knuckle
VDKNDPLALLEAINSVVTARCDSNIKLERAQAPRDWYTLTMREGEDIVEYGRRSLKLYARLASTGVPIAQRPLPKEQSLRFIDGLSTSISTYLDYKNYLCNSLTVTGVDIYPVTLVAAINSATKFYRGAKPSQPTIPSGTLAAVEDKTKSIPDSYLGGEKDENWKSKIKCHNCGKLGHLKKECRAKKKDTPPPTRNVSAAIADNVDINNDSSIYSTFGQMHYKEDNTSYQERYCNITLTSTPGNFNPHSVRKSVSQRTKTQSNPPPK